MIATGRGVPAEQRDQPGQQIKCFRAQSRVIATQPRPLRAQMDGVCRVAARSDGSRNPVRALERSPPVRPEIATRRFGGRFSCSGVDPSEAAIDKTIAVVSPFDAVWQPMIT